MNFGFSDTSIAELNKGNSFHLSPASITIQFSESYQIMNGIADSDHIFIGDVTNDFEGRHPMFLRFKLYLFHSETFDCQIKFTLPAGFE